MQEDFKAKRSPYVEWKDATAAERLLETDCIGPRQPNPLASIHFSPGGGGGRSPSQTINCATDAASYGGRQTNVLSVLRRSHERHAYAAPAMQDATMERRAVKIASEQRRVTWEISRPSLPITPKRSSHSKAEVSEGESPRSPISPSPNILSYVTPFVKLPPKMTTTRWSLKCLRHRRSYRAFLLRARPTTFPRILNYPNETEEQSLERTYEKS